MPGIKKSVSFFLLKNLIILIISLLSITTIAGNNNQKISIKSSARSSAVVKVNKNTPVKIDNFKLNKTNVLIKSNKVVAKPNTISTKIDNKKIINIVIFICIFA